MRLPLQPAGVRPACRYSVRNSAASSTSMQCSWPGAIQTAREGGTM